MENSNGNPQSLIGITFRLVDIETILETFLLEISGKSAIYAQVESKWNSWKHVSLTDSIGHTAVSRFSLNFNVSTVNAPLILTFLAEIWSWFLLFPAGMGTRNTLTVCVQNKLGLVFAVTDDLRVYHNDEPTSWPWDSTCSSSIRFQVEHSHLHLSPNDKTSITTLGFYSLCSDRLG